MLIAEELVLLSLDPDGTPARGQTIQAATMVGVTGALITELIFAGHLEVADGRIHLTGTAPTHPLLARTLESLAPFEGKKLKSKLAAVKHAGWTEVVDAMVAAGVVGREKAGLRPTRHPTVHPDVHAALLERVRSAAASSEPLDPRTAALLALAGPCQLLEVVAPARSDRRQAKQRIAEASESVPAAVAVKYVIEAVAAGATVAAATSS